MVLHLGAEKATVQETLASFFLRCYQEDVHPLWYVNHNGVTAIQCKSTVSAEHASQLSSLTVHPRSRTHARTHARIHVLVYVSVYVFGID